MDFMNEFEIKAPFEEERHGGLALKPQWIWVFLRWKPLRIRLACPGKPPAQKFGLETAQNLSHASALGAQGINVLKFPDYHVPMRRRNQARQTATNVLAGGFPVVIRRPLSIGTDDIGKNKKREKHSKGGTSSKRHRTPPAQRESPATARKGWKGWVEGSPPTSDKLINLDAFPVLQQKRTRSGKLGFGM
ncbi:hypothetical protein B0H14DRAFT_3737237 [Mycena olivaceomarginata]|nr:hypothetical protein B0H14DRAFT_3737237 [Mycena olivaceomarginata]